MWQAMLIFLIVPYGACAIVTLALIIKRI